MPAGTRVLFWRGEGGTKVDSRHKAIVCAVWELGDAASKGDMWTCHLTAAVWAIIDLQLVLSSSAHVFASLGPCPPLTWARALSYKSDKPGGGGLGLRGQWAPLNEQRGFVSPFSRPPLYFSAQMSRWRSAGGGGSLVSPTQTPHNVIPMMLSGMCCA